MRQAIVLLFLLAPFAQAADYVRTGMISHCTHETCLRVKAESLSQSRLDTQVWNFGPSVIDLPHQKGIRAQHFEAAQGYIDLETEYLVLKELKNSKHHDLLLNLQTGNVTYF
jgi:hypothetical protein